MERLDAIWNHPVFRAELTRLERMEQDRIYCRHGMPHLLDVARTAYILNLERQAKIPRDVLYAAALLHDIGRAVQYETGTPHEQAGEPIARAILQESAFTAEEQSAILECVRNHHGRTFGGTCLYDLIFEADKRSRPCFACAAEDSCKWTEQQKNHTLTI